MPIFNLNGWTPVNSLVKVGVFHEKEAKRLIGCTLEQHENNMTYVSVIKSGNFVRYRRKYVVLISRIHV